MKDGIYTKGCGVDRGIRVLHLVHAFQAGGAEQVVLNLVRHAGASVSNYVCSFREPNDFAPLLDREQTGFCCLHKRDGNDLRVIAALGRLIDRERIDIVHAQGWGTFIEGLAAAKCRAARRPAFIHAYHGKCMEDVEHGVPLRRRVAQRIAHLWTDACVAPAAHMAEEYARTVRLPRDRIDLIHNGIDTRMFGRGLKRGSRGTLGLRPDDFVVGFVGRLDPVKNLRGIVETFALFRRALGPDAARARLLIVGDGCGRNGAEEAAAARRVGEQVVFAGLRTDIPECMAAMDVYLQPSFYEGHSITILEAMATGLPVISSAVGGTPEIIRHGVSGLLFRPGEHEAMSRAILRLFRQPAMAAAIGGLGQRRVSEAFSVSRMVDGYEELYRRVLKRGGAPCAA